MNYNKRDNRLTTTSTNFTILLHTSMYNLNETILVTLPIRFLVSLPSYLIVTVLRIPIAFLFCAYKFHGGFASKQKSCTFFGK